MTVDVSVVIPTHNRAGAVIRAVQSALDQDPAPAEIIVVDDGSTDATAEALRTFQPRITLHSQDNQGPAAARNRGIALATGEFIAFLDSDDEWLPGKLRVQLELLHGPRKADVVGSGVEVLDRSGRLVKRVRPSPGPVELDRLLLDNLLPTSSVVLRRSCLDGLRPLFRTDLTLAEDWELWIRLAGRFPVALAPDILVRYHRSADSLHLNHPVPELAAAFRRVFEAAGQDPVLAPVVSANAARIRANIHFLLAYELYRAGRPWSARSQVIRSLTRPWDARWRSLLTILFLPRAWRDRLRANLP